MRTRPRLLFMCVACRGKNTEKGIAPIFLDESLAKEKLSITPRQSIFLSILSHRLRCLQSTGRIFWKCNFARIVSGTARAHSRDFKVPESRDKVEAIICPWYLTTSTCLAVLEDQFGVKSESALRVYTATPIVEPQSALQIRSISMKRVDVINTQLSKRNAPD